MTSTDTEGLLVIQRLVPYEDGWTRLFFYGKVLGTFNTDDLSVNLNIAGDDTGNSSSWYGPIVDNINLPFLKNILNLW